MKKLNLKKHVAIALAILSANGSMSVFAGGDGKGEQTSGSMSNAPATDLRSQNYKALEVFYIFEKIFKQQLHNRYSKNGCVWIAINNLDQLDYPEVRAAFDCIKSRIINRSEDQAVNIDDVLKELESTLKIKKVPEEMIDTILRALFTLVKYPNSLHLDMFINNVQNRTLYICELVNFLARIKINKTKAECVQAREELEKAEAIYKQAEAKWFQAEAKWFQAEAKWQKDKLEYATAREELEKAEGEGSLYEAEWKKVHKEWRQVKMRRDRDEGNTDSTEFYKADAKRRQAQEKQRQAQEKLNQVRAVWNQINAKYAQVDAELEKALSEYIGDHLEFDKACEERNAAEVKWGGFQEANKII